MLNEMTTQKTSKNCHIFGKQKLTIVFPLMNTRIRENIVLA